MVLTRKQALHFFNSISTTVENDQEFLRIFEELANDFENSYEKSTNPTLYINTCLAYLDDLLFSERDIPNNVIGENIISFDIESIRDISCGVLMAELNNEDYHIENLEHFKQYTLLLYCRYYLIGRFVDIKKLDFFTIQKFDLNIMEEKKYKFLKKFHATLKKEKLIECKLATFKSHFCSTKEFLSPIKWNGLALELGLLFIKLHDNNIINNSDFHKLTRIHFCFSTEGDISRKSLSSGAIRTTVNEEYYPWINEIVGFAADNLLTN